MFESPEEDFKSWLSFASRQKLSEAFSQENSCAHQQKMTMGNVLGVIRETLRMLLIANTGATGYYSGMQHALK